MNQPSSPPGNILPHTQGLLNLFYTHCEHKGLSKETLRFYRDLLNKYAKTFPELPLSPEPIEAWIASHKSSPERRYSAFRAIRTFYNYLELRHWPDKAIPNPIDRVSKPRVPVKVRTVLSLQEIQQLLEYPGHDPRTKALLHLLVDTGIRIGEVTGITHADINGQTIKVCGKTGERVVPISGQTRYLLLSLKPNKETGRIFNNNAHWYTVLVTRAFKAAGLKGSPHELRHAFASHWQGSDQALKQIGGWASWQMVDHYSHLRTEKAIEQHKAYSPIARIYGHSEPAMTAPIEQPPPADHLKMIVNLAQQLGEVKAQHNFPQPGPGPTVRIEPAYDFANFITNMPGMPGQYQVAKAMFFCHSIAYNFFTYMASNHTRGLKELLLSDVDPECNENDQGIATIIGSLWNKLAADNRNVAMVYRELAGETAMPEELDVLKE